MCRFLVPLTLGLGWWYLITGAGLHPREADWVIGGILFLASHIYAWHEKRGGPPTGEPPSSL